MFQVLWNRASKVKMPQYRSRKEETGEISSMCDNATKDTTKRKTSMSLSGKGIGV